MTKPPVHVDRGETAGGELGAMRYQERVASWLSACLPPKVARDRKERTHRFVEEIPELAQENGCTKD